MAFTLSSIKKKLNQPKDYYALYWLERHLGNYDEAYRYAKMYYLRYVYNGRGNKPNKPAKNVQDTFISMCKSIDKPVPDFDKFGVES